MEFEICRFDNEGAIKIQYFDLKPQFGVTRPEIKKIKLSDYANQCLVAACEVPKESAK